METILVCWVGLGGKNAGNSTFPGVLTGIYICKVAPRVQDVLDRQTKKTLQVLDLRSHEP